MIPITIKETGIQAFHRRLAIITASESSKNRDCIRAQHILRHEAERRSKEVKLRLQEASSSRLKEWFAKRPKRSPNW